VVGHEPLSRDGVELLVTKDARPSILRVPRSIGIQLHLPGWCLDKLLASLRRGACLLALAGACLAIATRFDLSPVALGHSHQIND
jgi:hypothetical protein